MDIPPATLERLLDTWPVARLATLTPETARPHLVPVVFARSGGALWSPIDAKPKRARRGDPSGLARVRNIRANPAVCLLLDHYDADWERLWWIRVDGSAEVVEGVSPAVEAAADALRAKYPQYGPGSGTSLFRDGPVLLRIEPARVRSWCASPPP